MAVFTKEMLNDGGEKFRWDIIEYDIDTETLETLPLDPTNGYDVLDFINSFPAELGLSLDQQKIIESLIIRKIPVVKESRTDLKRYLIAHLKDLKS